MGFFLSFSPQHPQLQSGRLFLKKHRARHARMPQASKTTKATTISPLSIIRFSGSAPNGDGRRTKSFETPQETPNPPAAQPQTLPPAKISLAWVVSGGFLPRTVFHNSAAYRLSNMSAELPISATRQLLQNHDVLESLLNFLCELPMITRERGFAYARSGAVGYVECSSNPLCLSAQVSGTDTYDTALTYNAQADSWDLSCSCPVGVNCKHAYALGFVCIRACSEEMERENATAAAAAAAASASASALTAAAASASALTATAHADAAPTTDDEPPPPSFSDVWAPQLAELLGRPVTAHERQRLEKLDDLFTIYRAKRARLTPLDYVNAGFSTNAVRNLYNLYGETNLLGAVVTNGSVPAHPWEFWQCIAVLYEDNGVEIEEIFRPKTNTAARRAILARLAAKAETARWRTHISEYFPTPVTAAAPQKNTAAANFAGVIAVRAKLHSDGRFYLETLRRPKIAVAPPTAPVSENADADADAAKTAWGAPAHQTWKQKRAAADARAAIRAAADADWQEPPPRWLNDLRAAEVHQLDVLAPPARALANIYRAVRRDSYYYSDSAGILTPDEIGIVLANPAATATLVLPDGSPWRVEPEPLVLRFVSEPDDSQLLRAQLFIPDGKAPLSATLVVARSPEGAVLYLHGKRVWRGPPKPTGDKCLLPVSALSDPTILNALRGVGAELPPEITRRLRPVSTRPLLRCWCEPHPNNAEKQLFCVRLFAVSDVPKCAQVLIGENLWEWSDEFPPPPATAAAYAEATSTTAATTATATASLDPPILDCDLSAASAIAAAFPAFSLKQITTETWGRTFTRTLIGDFFEWLDTFTPRPDTEAIGELADLFAPPVRARIDFTAAPVGESG
ncbi:MAG: hypothetical protein LBT53_00460, partial [Puniceicoccales bacterium]|nr:hypothetical protein [Puniceicoccales bacterium]